MNFRTQNTEIRTFMLRWTRLYSLTSPFCGCNCHRLPCWWPTRTRSVPWLSLIWRDLRELILFWSRVKWSELRWSSWGQKYHVHWGDLILRELDCVVTISFWVYLLLCLFQLALWLFDLFCNEWVCVCVGVLVICVLVFVVFSVLFHLCIFILICFVCTSVWTTATEWQLNCS